MLIVRLILIPIARPMIGEEEKNAVLEVLESGQIAQGPKVAEFEEAFALLCGVKYAVATSSGTTALYVALLAHGVGIGDEVITTSFSFIATANSILYTGATPIFVDIEEDSFNINPYLIEKSITSRTKAIVLVHLYGNPCDMETIVQIAHKHGLVIVEDACQAHDASIKGKKVGSFGTGCFSFYPTKNMVTAEGGMVTTNSRRVAEKVQALRAHGSHSRMHYYDLLGYNFRMSDIYAAIGLAQLQKLSQFTLKRIENAGYLTNYFRSLDFMKTPKVKNGSVHVFHQYTVRIKEHRDKVCRILNQRKIGATIYYKVPIHCQPVYYRLGYRDSLPVTERMCDEVFSLPVYPNLTYTELEKVGVEVLEVCSKFA